MVNLLPIRGSDGEIRLINQKEIPRSSSLPPALDATTKPVDDIAQKTRLFVDAHPVLQVPEDVERE